MPPRYSLQPGRSIKDENTGRSFYLARPNAAPMDPTELDLMARRLLDLLNFAEAATTNGANGQ